tara:strand:- start:1150 stop:2919 length:1770 start_codon:yes stop_codon:yes gene_type:complete
MTSQIIPTNPTSGSASTSSVRENFRIADEEITKLQRTNIDAQELTGGPISYSVTYPLAESVFEYVDGMRIAARVNQTNSASSVLSLSVNSSTSILLKSLDGLALAAGDLVADQYYEFILNSPGGGATPYFACVNINKNIRLSSLDVEGQIIAESLAVLTPSGNASSSFTSATGTSVLTVQSTFDGAEADESAAIEIGAKSLAFLDFKTPNSDDYDLRIFHSEPLSYSMINSLSQDLYLRSGQKVALQHGGTNTKLHTTDTGIEVTGGIAADYIDLNGSNSSDTRTPVTGDVFCKRIRLDDPTDDLTDNFTIYTENNTSGGGIQAGSMVLSSQDNPDDKIIFRMGNYPDGTVDVLTATATDIRIPATKALRFGAESDGQLKIFEGSNGNGYIQQDGIGDLVIKGQNGYLSSDSVHVASWGSLDISLKYNGLNRITTTGAGATINGVITAGGYAGLPASSTTSQGIVELATSAEVKAGVDAVKALTAANLLRVAVDNTEVTASGTQQGSIEIAGVIVKWGRVLSTSNNAQQFVFDDAFPNFCSVVNLTRNQANGSAQIGVSLRTRSNFTIDRDNAFSTSQQVGCFFIAIGG